MANFSGVLASAAVKKPSQISSYGEFANGDTTNQIPLLSESMSNTVAMDDAGALEGLAGMQEPVLVSENPSGTVSCELWYAGLEYLFSAAMGFECPSLYTGIAGTPGSGGSPAPDHATPKAFLHLFELDDTLHRTAWLVGERLSSASTDPAATFWNSTHQKVRCFDLNVNKGDGSGLFWHYSNCMVRSMTIKAGIDGCTVDFDLVAHANQMNTTAGTWSLPVNSRHRVVFPNMTVGFSAAGSSSPTAIAVQELSLTLTNPLTEEWESGGMYWKSEPVLSGPRTVTGSIKLARYTSATFPDALVNETDMQLSVLFTDSSQYILNTAGTLYSATMSPLMRFMLPLVRITKAEFPVSGPGIISGSIEFSAHAATAPTWITNAARGITIKKNSAMYLLLQNNRGHSFLRDNHTGAPGSPGVLP